MFVDLHLHTTYSDGSFTPEELILEAKKLNYSAIAVTDHDTVAGLNQVIQFGKKYGIETVPGIEFNTSYKNCDVHILGYFIDRKSNKLLKLLKKIKDERRERIEKMIRLLDKQFGFKINMKEIKEISSNNILGRGHIARLLTEKNYVDSWEEVFNKYIGRGKPGYVDRNKITPFEAIDIIKEAEGIPVIAHPGLITNQQIIDQLINYGVSGIEVYYTEHDNKMTEKYLKFAKRNELLITGGSDCHGPKNKEGKKLGKIKLDYCYLKELKKYKSILNDKPFKKDLLS
ncbi:MAG: PHP domain-containing protein [Halanaerobiales bacterium]|nr:PHP domain-containing protein [Halanaerobiales bacterium]